jgi:hypothetical protein
MTGAAEPEPVTQLVDHVFALSGLLAQEGDRLTAPYALTAARWLVLGALQDGPSSAAEIARDVVFSDSRSGRACSASSAPATSSKFRK